jgi:glycosyltransferase involved in cell wall biosynthesis
MSDLYSEALVLAHPTFLSESFCRTAVEAMKHGVPIVYTAEGNLPDLIGHLAGTPLPIDATPEQWKEAVELVKKEQWRGEYGKQRAVWMEQYDDSKLAIQGMVNHLLADLPPGLDIVMAVPDFPGCYTAVQHLVELHNLQYFETIPNVV